jgi:hypothetical protein
VHAENIAILFNSLKLQLLMPFTLRSGLKTSDQVQGQGAGRSRKRSIHGYVSIYRRPATQPLGLRWGFETTSGIQIEAEEEGK